MRRILLLLTTAALLAGCASHAVAASRMEIAVEDDNTFGGRPNVPAIPLATGLSAARGLNASWIRMIVAWNESMPGSQAGAKKMPKKVRWSFKRWDTAITAAHEQGMNVELTLSTPAPAWATGNHHAGTFRPNASRYGQFVAAAVKHFRKTVRRYSLINEPNWIGWLSPVRDQGKMYRALYMAGYKQVRRFQPRATVLMGETSANYSKGLATAPLKLLRDMLCVNAKLKLTNRRCKPLAANGYAVHPYDWDHAPTHRYPGADNVTIGTLSRVTTLLDKLQRKHELKVLGAKRMPLYLTEFGYRNYGRHSTTPETKRARYLVQAFQIAQRNPRVRQLAQYQLYQTIDTTFFWQSYLVNVNNVRTASYIALQKWSNAAAKKHQVARPGPVRH